MTQYEMLFLMRQHLADEQAVGWESSTELLAFLDRATDQLSEQLIAVKDPTMIKELHLTAKGATLPEDFVAFVGKAPVNLVGRQCTPFGDTAEDVRYWAKFPYPSQSGDGDELPLTREQALLVVDIACLFALDRNEFDVSQSMGLLNGMNSAISQTRSR